MAYDPNGGGAGAGRLTAEIRRALDNVSLGVSSEDFPSTGTPFDLNAFGLISLDFNANYSTVNVFIDDLTYTTRVPEPSSLVLLAVAGLFLAGAGRRLRK